MALRRHHAQTVRVCSSRYKVDYTVQLMNFLNAEGYQNQSLVQKLQWVCLMGEFFLFSGIRKPGAQILERLNPDPEGFLLNVHPALYGIWPFAISYFSSTSSSPTPTSPPSLSTWHLTSDTWYMTCDTGWWVNILSKFQVPSSSILGDVLKDWSKRMS